MDDQPPYKSFKKPSYLRKEEIKEKLKFPMSKLERLLKTMTENVKEKTGILQIDTSTTLIYFNFKISGNELMGCEYEITTYLYNKDKIIECYSDSQNSSYIIKCTNYNDKPFDLFYPLQSLSFILGMRNSILYILDSILPPRVLTYIGKQYNDNIPISAVVSMNSKESIKENPFVYIDLNNQIKENPEKSENSDEFRYKFRYNNGRIDIKMDWGF
jgi:hypothetical protein